MQLRMLQTVKPLVPPTLRVHRRKGKSTLRCRSMDPATVASNPAVSVLGGEHILICLVETNKFLSDSSKEALTTGCKMVKAVSGKCTVYVANMEKGLSEEQEKEQHDKTMRETVEWHLGDKGVPEYSIKSDSSPACVAASIGDLAEEQDADMVVLSTASMHATYVNANLLAEFCPCPVLMIP